MITKKLLFNATVLLALTNACDSSLKSEKCIRECAMVTVHFSPNGGVTESLVEGIDSAHSRIYVNAFSFTSKPIGEALVRAQSRGVKVDVILDRENLKNKSSQIHLLHEHNVSIYIDDKHAIAHNKTIVVDDKIFTGSFNFTNSAEERNAENSILIEDAKITELYVKNWLEHHKHSFKYNPDN